MGDAIDDAWDNPAAESEVTNKPKEDLSNKEIRRRYELLDKEVMSYKLNERALKKQLGEVSQQVTELQKKLDWANSDRDAQTKILQAQEETISKLSQKNAGGGDDRVIYKGKVHKIVRVNTAKWFALDDFRKRFVEEDDTVIVIDRKGT